MPEVLDDATERPGLSRFRISEEVVAAGGARQVEIDFTSGSDDEVKTDAIVSR